MGFDDDPSELKNTEQKSTQLVLRSMKVVKISGATHKLPRNNTIKDALLFEQLANRLGALREDQRAF